MVQLAGQHGDVAARSMRAEDMAQQIADTNLAQARLQKSMRACSNCSSAAIWR